MPRALPRSAAVLCSALVVLAAAPATGEADAPAAERLPDLDQEAPAQLQVAVAGKGRRPDYRLGFRSAVRNVGVGPLIVSGARPDEHTPYMRVDQLIDRDGAPQTVIPGVGRMKYTASPDHRHWHYLQFERYELQRYELRRAGTARAVARDRKTGFCLGDRYRVTSRVLPAAPPEPVYTGRCGLGQPTRLRMRAGISVGYGDNYSAFLEGQDLSLSGLRDGRYVLVHRVNRNRRLRELSYDNNAASVLLDLRWRDSKPYLRILRSCPDSARCDDPPTASAKPAAAAPFMPNDAGAAGRPGGWAEEQWNFAGPFGVRAPEAWGNLLAAGAPGGKGVTIAVLDTGIAYSNRPPFRRSPDLSSARFVRGYDFVDHDPYPVDEAGHGTHVASTIAEATNNQRGLTGLAYGARIMPVRVLDRAGLGDPRVIAKGVRFASRRGAKIINLSLSFDARVIPAQIRGLLRAIDAAHRRGSLVVGAAGNAGIAAVAEPARASHALAVGATTENGCLASFSNRGLGLDLVAPGGGGDAALADDLACSAGRLGRSIYQVTLAGRRLDRFGVPRDYIGTSMAAAHVSASAALVVASGVLGPDPTPAAIQQRLEQTARDLGRPGYDVRYGWGLVDAAAATGAGAGQATAAASTPAAHSSRSSAAR